MSCCYTELPVHTTHTVRICPKVQLECHDSWLLSKEHHYSKTLTCSSAETIGHSKFALWPFKIRVGSQNGGGQAWETSNFDYHGYTASIFWINHETMQTCRLHMMKIVRHHIHFHWSEGLVSLDYNTVIAAFVQVQYPSTPHWVGSRWYEPYSTGKTWSDPTSD